MTFFREALRLQLTIQPEKEEVIVFKQDDKGVLRAYKNDVVPTPKNLQYLGFEFNGQKRYIRSSSVSRFYRRMKAGTNKTLKMAYGSRRKGDKVFERKLHERFTHLGGQNFLTYAYRASAKMNSQSIKKQVANHFKILDNTITDKSIKLTKRLNARKK